MADFVETGQSKTAVREIAAPLSLAGINTLVAEVTGIDNPFATTGYTQGGVAHAGAEISRESYTGRVVFENTEGRSVGTISLRTSSQAALGDSVSRIVADADLATEMGGEAVRDTEKESYSVTVRCHDANGETYMVTFGRRQVRIASFADDAIRARVETWADGKAALA